MQGVSCTTPSPRGVVVTRKATRPRFHRTTSRTRQGSRVALQVHGAPLTTTTPVPGPGVFSPHPPTCLRVQRERDGLSPLPPQVTPPAQAPLAAPLVFPRQPIEGRPRKGTSLAVTRTAKAGAPAPGAQVAFLREGTWDRKAAKLASALVTQGPVRHRPAVFRPCFCSRPWSGPRAPR